MILKLRLFSKNYDCYSFSNFTALKEQSLQDAAFYCCTPGDYTLIATSDCPVHGFDKVETDWRCIAIDGQMPFELTGIAASITAASSSPSSFNLFTSETSVTPNPEPGAALAFLVGLGVVARSLPRRARA